MAYIRQQVMGTTPQDIKKINDNTEAIWYKVHGDITFSDTNNDMQNRVMTQWLPVQGEGNIDSTHPLYIRFYVPPNVKQIKSSNFSMLTSRYRMDSGITKGGGHSTVASSVTSSSAGQYTGTSGSGASGSAISSGGGVSAYVDNWGANGGWKAPKAYLDDGAYLEVVPSSGNSLYYPQSFDSSGGDYLVARCKRHDFLNSETSFYGVDMRAFQHVHRIPPHGHSISIQPHSHVVEIPPHDHSVDIKVDFKDHSHDLNEGIKESQVAPSGVVMIINDTQVSNALNGDNKTVDNIDISPYINVGAWNIIKIESTSVARATIYGTIELLIK